MVALGTGRCSSCTGTGVKHCLGGVTFVLTTDMFWMLECVPLQQQLTCLHSISCLFDEFNSVVTVAEDVQLTLMQTSRRA